MKDYLVVANQTLGGAHLMEELQRRVDDGPCRFHVVVPANFNPDTWTHTLEQAHTVASERLLEAIQRFAELGAEVDGEVGDERPLDAIHDALRRWPCDEVILSTLPAGASRWLKMDLVSRAGRTLPIPVTHVEATEASSP
jgi:GABA permease